MRLNTPKLDNVCTYITYLVLKYECISVSTWSLKRITYWKGVCFLARGVHNIRWIWGEWSCIRRLLHASSGLQMPTSRNGTLDTSLIYLKSIKILFFFPPQIFSIISTFLPGGLLHLFWHGGFLSSLYIFGTSRFQVSYSLASCPLDR